MLDILSMAPAVASIQHDGTWLWGIQKGVATARDIQSQPSLVRWVEGVLSAAHEGGRVPNDIQKSALAKLDAHYSVRRVKAGLIQEFVTVPSEPDAAREFIRKHGVFQAQDVEPSELPARLKQWRRQVRDNGQQAFALRLAVFWEHQKRLQRFLDLHTALVAGNRQQAQRVAVEMGRQNPKFVLRDEFMDNVMLAAPGLRWKDGAAKPFLVVSYVLPCLYAQLWKQFIDQSPPARCPKCKKFFQMGRYKKSYCSESCRNAARQAKYRKRLHKLLPKTLKDNISVDSRNTSVVSSK